MVTINPSSICTKFEKSIDGWILPFPVMENGEYKIRMYMNRAEDNRLAFNEVYTYIVPNFETLVRFFMFQSFGQAYHGLFRLMQDRTSFFGEEDHKEGFFLIEKAIKDGFLGSTAMICSQIQETFDKIGFEFSLEPITEKDRKTVDEIVQEINKIDISAIM